jgi:hypothetical protein
LLYAARVMTGLSAGLHGPLPPPLAADALLPPQAAATTLSAVTLVISAPALRRALTLVDLT